MQNFNFGAKLASTILPNKLYADIFLQLLFCPTGEFASFLQFSYHSALLVPHNIEAGKFFEEIIEDDLCHQKILAECIVLLGKVPHASSFDGKIFSAKQVSKNQSVANILFDNIELKEKAVIAYKTALPKIKNLTLQKLLEVIIFDEQKHLSTLKKLAKHLNLQAN